jgi:hypothetical protein
MKKNEKIKILEESINSQINNSKKQQNRINETMKYFSKLLEIQINKQIFKENKNEKTMNLEQLIKEDENELKMMEIDEGKILFNNNKIQIF